MVTKEVKQIDLLVHPDFNLSYTATVPFGEWPRLHPINYHMQLMWEVRARALEPQTIMFYFSLLRERDFCHALTNPNKIVRPIFRWDADRIRRFQALLGDRFFLFDYHHIPAKREIDSLFKERGFSYDPADLTLFAYGEILELCVKYRAAALQDNLGIWVRRVIYADEALSLNCQTAEGIYQWRENSKLPATGRYF